MNSTLTLTTCPAATVRTSTAARLIRSLVCKWDLLAVLGFMASSTVYGVYALTQMTGF